MDLATIGKDDIEADNRIEGETPLSGSVAIPTICVRTGSVSDKML